MKENYFYMQKKFHLYLLALSGRIKIEYKYISS